MDKNIDSLFKEALFVCEYGSSVYGCSSKQSDKDYVVLLDDLHAECNIFPICMAL